MLAKPIVILPLLIKSSIVPQTLWANQKAIALATNDNTKAYSHYNMGKIYENNQDFAQLSNIINWPINTNQARLMMKRYNV
jgi:hypothetical protein